MALLFIIILCLLLRFISQRISDALSRFICYSFVLYWMGSMILSLFNPLGLYSVSIGSYLILLTGVIAFVLGIAFPKCGMETPFGIKKVLESSTEKSMKNKYYIVFIVLLTLYFIPFVKQALLMSAITGKAARVTMESETFGDNALFVNAYYFLGYPLFFTSLTFLFGSFLYNKKKYLLVQILIIIYSVIFVIINAGRIVYVIIGIYLLIVYAIKQCGVIKFKLRTVILSVFVCFCVLLGVSSTTNYRNFGKIEMDTSVLKESLEETADRFVSYSVLPLVLFDRAMKTDMVEQYGGHKFGRATFSGVDIHFGAALRKLGIQYKDMYDVLVNKLDQIYYDVSPTQEANYAYTAMFYHYMDFGIFGVIFFPFLFGLIFRKLVINFYKTPNLYSILLISFLYYITLYSIFTCTLIKSWACYYIIFLIFMSKRVNKII